MSRTGFLTKEGGSGFFKNWKRRFCVLDEENAVLKYFEGKDTSVKPNGVVILEGCTVDRIPKKEKGKDNCLCIKGPNRTFYAYADTEAEIESWVASIKTVIEGKQNGTKSDAPEPQDNATLYSGWLFKEAGSGKNWRKRFFVLRRRDMSYYKDRNSTDPQGSFPIAGARLLTETSGQSSSLSKFNFLSGGGGGNPALQFSIECAGQARTYRLEARNKEELNTWTNMIKNAIEKAGKAPAGDIKDDEDEDDKAQRKPANLAAFRAEQDEPGDVDTEPDEGGAEKDERFLNELRKTTQSLL